jgi:hypothetical protein
MSERLLQPQNPQEEAVVADITQLITRGSSLNTSALKEEKKSSEESIDKVIDEFLNGPDTQYYRGDNSY